MSDVKVRASCSECAAASQLTTVPVTRPSSSSTVTFLQDSAHDIKQQGSITLCTDWNNIGHMQYDTGLISFLIDLMSNK